MGRGDDDGDGDLAMSSSNLVRSVARVLSYVAFFTACGANAAPAGDPFDAKARAHWAFQKIVRVPPPVIEGAWVRNPIDAFIAAELLGKKIQPGPPADKSTLLRRVTLDLIGVPPTPEEVEHFLADPSPDAFDRVVDRLLGFAHDG